MVVLTILTIAANGFIEALAGNVADDLYQKLKGDPAKNAYKQALGAAIQRYATGERLFLARALTRDGGVLSDKEVAAEISQVIRFEREPNIQLIGKRWKDALDSPPAWHDFTEESRLLLGYLQSELRATDVFRPVFDAKSLSTIAENTSASAQSLANIEDRLGDLIALMDARFGELTGTFAKATYGIRDQIRDFTRYIDEKTRGFVGRQFVFDAVNQFVQSNPRGYFFVRGDPGIGKSALSAQTVKQHGYIHHFNIRAEGINKASDFLRNVCAQLIAVYDLQHTVLPPEATQDAGFLNKVLGEVSDKLGDQKCIILVDALDEVDNLGVSPGANALYLPITLPKGIFVIATTRKVPLTLRIDCEQATLDIEQDDAGNIADVREYVVVQLPRAGIQAYIAAQAIDGELFVDHIVEKSQGNFMYLRYVLPEIESGAYKDLGLGAIPVGLQNYYEDHWRRMRGLDEKAWFDYKLPVLVALTVVKEPVSIDLVRDFSKVDDRRRIRAVISEWQQFLHEERVEYQEDIQYRYRLYHASFFDFIAAKQEIANERVDLKAAHGQIADTLWKELFDE